MALKRKSSFTNHELRREAARPRLRRAPTTNHDLIGVLMGGPSSEREISLKSGKAVCAALAGAGVRYLPIDIKTEEPEENARLLKSSGIGCAFVALHGRFGEDGQIQEILDKAKIPYTGSGVMASRLAMDKAASRRIFRLYGLPVPRCQLLDNVSYRGFIPKIGFPLVVKPASQGSSIGISFLEGPEGFAEALEEAFRFDDRVIIEEFIKGRELTVGVLNDQALPLVEIVTKNRFFDYAAKYSHGLTEYIVPARLDEKISAKIQDLGIQAHRLLGCFGCSRVDMILDDSGAPYILELNSIPGLTETSLLPKAASAAGIDFSRLCLRLIELAYEKD